MTETKSVEKVAKERLEREEAERRHARLRELEREEKQRRRTEAAEQEEERRLAEARERAAVLGRRRRELEDRLEEQMGPVLRTINELVELNKRHLPALSAVKLLPPGAPLLRKTIARWLHVRFSAFLGGPNAVTDPYDGAPLTERDPLTPEDTPEEVS